MESRVRREKPRPEAKRIVNLLVQGVTVSVLMLGMPGLRSTQSSDPHDRQIYTIVRLVTQVRGHRRSDKSRLAVSLIYGVWLFSWF